MILGLWLHQLGVFCCKSVLGNVLPYDDRLVEYLTGYEYDGYEVSLGVGTCGIRVTGLESTIGDDLTVFGSAFVDETMSISLISAAQLGSLNSSGSTP
jgi:hypothetical protein